MSLSCYEKILCQTVEEELKGLPREQIIPHLFAQGLLSYKAVEALGIRHYIESLILKKHSTGSALIEAAQRFCCSYEKVRHIYYYKPKRKHS